jgi:hypothetical protein
MSNSTLIGAVVKSTPHIVLLSLSLSWTYFTLGWRVRKTRGAFEKQLVSQGMSKEDAQQLSAFYEELKNSITTTVKQSLTNGAFR